MKTIIRTPAPKDVYIPKPGDFFLWDDDYGNHRQKKPLLCFKNDADRKVEHVELDTGAYGHFGYDASDCKFTQLKLVGVDGGAMVFEHA
jgi:hypothetical protein